MQWHTQAGNITTNLKVKTFFNLPELSATKIVVCNFHVDDSAKNIYDMILGRSILIELILTLKLSDNVIQEDSGPSKGSTSPTVDLGMYEFKHLYTVKLTTE